MADRIGDLHLLYSDNALATATMRIPIKSMHCNSRVTRIELSLQLMLGVVAACASVRTNAVDVEYQP